MDRKNEVTDVKVNVKRPDRRSIYINGEFAFSISEGIFYDFGINIGSSLTEEEIKTLTQKDEREKVKTASLNLLSYRPRSVLELKNRLKKKGWKTEIIESVILELEEKGFLDDREFAAMIARDRTQRKYLGPFAIRDELKKAGIGRGIIETVVEDTYRNTPPQQIIKNLLKKKGIDLNKPMETKDKTRLVNLLRRKGYSWDHMATIISRLKTD